MRSRLGRIGNWTTYGWTMPGIWGPTCWMPWAAGYDTVAVPCAEGCLGPQRIGRDALEAVERIHPNADVTILDFTAPDTEREQALGALFARMEKKRA